MSSHPHDPAYDPVALVNRHLRGLAPRKPILVPDPPFPLHMLPPLAAAWREAHSAAAFARHAAVQVHFDVALAWLFALLQDFLSSPSQKESASFRTIRAFWVIARQNDKVPISTALARAEGSFPPGPPRAPES